jgi:orotate phosphoribosyltransferase
MKPRHPKLPVPDREKRVKLDVAVAMISQSEWGTKEGATVRSYFDVDKLFTADFRFQESDSVVGSSRRQFVREVITDLDAILAERAISRIAFVDEHEIGPVGGLWLAMTVALELNMDLLLLRPWKELEPSRIKGKTPEAGERFLIFTDVVSTGRTILDALQVLEHYAASCDVAYTLVERDDDAGLIKARQELLGDRVEILCWVKSSTLLDLEPIKRMLNAVAQRDLPMELGL